MLMIGSSQPSPDSHCGASKPWISSVVAPCRRGPNNFRDVTAGQPQVQHDRAFRPRPDQRQGVLSGRPLIHPAGPTHLWSRLRRSASPPPTSQPCQPCWTRLIRSSTPNRGTRKWPPRLRAHVGHLKGAAAGTGKASLAKVMEAIAATAIHARHLSRAKPRPTSPQSGQEFRVIGNTASLRSR